jgi:hypothetical protein
MMELYLLHHLYFAYPRNYLYHHREISVVLQMDPSVEAVSYD